MNLCATVIFQKRKQIPLVMVTTGSRRVSARIADFLFCNQGVVGSNPTAGTNKFKVLTPYS